MKELYFKKFFKLQDSFNIEDLIKLKSDVNIAMKSILRNRSVDELYRFQRWEYDDMLLLIQYIDIEIANIEAEHQKNQKIEKKLKRI